MDDYGRFPRLNSRSRDRRRPGCTAGDTPAVFTTGRVPSPYLSGSNYTSIGISRSLPFRFGTPRAPFIRGSTPLFHDRCRVDSFAVPPTHGYRATSFDLLPMASGEAEGNHILLDLAAPLAELLDPLDER